MVAQAKGEYIDARNAVAVTAVDYCCTLSVPGRAAEAILLGSVRPSVGFERVARLPASPCHAGGWSEVGGKRAGVGMNAVLSFRFGGALSHGVF